MAIHLSAALGKRIQRYVRRGNFFVDGWLSTDAAVTICVLGQVQQELVVGGAVAEIGVHRGKLFILLYLLSHGPEKAVAIDVFEDQHLNVDCSGQGDFPVFLRNLERHADSTRLVVHKGTSLAVTGDDLMRLAEGKVRLFSVDGGHTAEITEHDMEIADASLAEGGIIIVDDAFNDQFPGVSDGIHRYFLHPRNLVPFALGANKTFFCRPPYAESYRVAASTVATESRIREFLGTPVAVLHFRRLTLKDRLARSAIWTDLRTTRAGMSLRSIWRIADNLRRRLMRREVV